VRVAPWLVLAGCVADPVLSLPSGPAPDFAEGLDSVQWAEIEAAIDAGAGFYFLDVRPEPDFLLLHVDGALHVPFHAVEAQVERLPGEAWYVAYGGEQAEPLDRVLRVLRAAGFQRVVGTALDFRDLVELGIETRAAPLRTGGGGAPDSGPAEFTAPDAPG
jgi:rhodanese-related sulfurtransferase